jgi:hypothetical protein
MFLQRFARGTALFSISLVLSWDSLYSEESSQGDAERELPFGKRPAKAGRGSLRHYAEERILQRPTTLPPSLVFVVAFLQACQKFDLYGRQVHRDCCVLVMCLTY